MHIAYSKVNDTNVTKSEVLICLVPQRRHFHGPCGLNQTSKLQGSSLDCPVHISKCLSRLLCVDILLEGSQTSSRRLISGSSPPLLVTLKQDVLDVFHRLKNIPEAQSIPILTCCHFFPFLKDRQLPLLHTRARDQITTGRPSPLWKSQRLLPGRPPRPRLPRLLKPPRPRPPPFEFLPVEDGCCCCCCCCC